jgi:hypothetical protein
MQLSQQPTEPRYFVLLDLKKKYNTLKRGRTIDILEGYWVENPPKDHFDGLKPGHDGARTSGVLWIREAILFPHYIQHRSRCRDPRVQVGRVG